MTLRTLIESAREDPALTVTEDGSRKFRIAGPNDELTIIFRGGRTGWRFERALCMDTGKTLGSLHEVADAVGMTDEKGEPCRD